MPARHAWHLRARWTTAPCALPRQIVQNWGSTSTGATDGDITKILCQLREYQDEIKYQTTQVDALATSVLGLEGSLESVASKLAAVEGTLSKMAAARPKAPPPSMPVTAPSCRCGTRTGTVHATRSVGSTSSRQRHRCWTAYDFPTFAAKCTDLAAEPERAALEADANTAAGEHSARSSRAEPGDAHV